MKQSKMQLIQAYFARLKARKLHKDRKEGPISAGTITAIQNSITNRWLLNINYEGSEEISPGRRWIESYTYGIHKTTFNRVLRAWEYQGTTLTEVPGWKLFRLDRIRGTAPLTSKKFNKPRLLFNPDDEDMSVIIQAVTFPNAPQS
jgi:predicted DNA-binding transcriptional regulator YafY